MSKPAVTFKKVNTKYTVDLYFRPDVFDKLEDKKNFTASNGFKVVVIDTCHTKLTAEELIINNAVRDKKYTFTNVEIDAEKLTKALDELAVCDDWTVVCDDWTVHGPTPIETEPRIRSKITPQEGTVDIKLRVTPSAFNWLFEHGKFKSMHDVIITVTCGDTCYLENYQLLYINEKDRGNEISMKSCLNEQQFQDLLIDFELVSAAFKELNAFVSAHKSMDVYKI